MVDIHPQQNTNGSFDAGNMCYMCSGPTGEDDGPFTEQTGEVWIELPTFGAGAGTRPIDGIVILKYISGGTFYFPYEIHEPDGTTVYTSPTSPTGGNAPFSDSSADGNYLTFERVTEFATRRFYIGSPTEADGANANGTFVDPADVGASYVSPGYQS